MENTWVRSTPGRKNVASVTRRNTSKNPGVNMSPSRAITAISTRSAPPELVPILDEGPHVLVLDRHELGESGIDPKPGSQPPHRQGDEHERRNHQTPASKQELFDSSGHENVRENGFGRFAPSAEDYSSSANCRTPNSPISSAPPWASGHRGRYSLRASRSLRDDTLSPPSRLVSTLPSRPVTSITPVGSRMAPVRVALVPVGTCVHVSPASPERYRWPRSPMSSSSSSFSASTPYHEPAYGDGSSRQVSPPSSERYATPASAAMYRRCDAFPFGIRQAPARSGGSRPR